MKLRAAIYARVSSQAQRERHTIESQLHALPAFVAAQGWEIVGTYVDDGRSAKTGQLDRRDGFARLVRDAEAKRFDVLVVADIDRLTRTDDMRERAQILGPFQRAGIRIVTPTGGELDLRTMLGELYVTLHAIVAAEENRKRAERIKAGKLRAIAEGRKPAGPTPYGLRYTRATGTWSIDEAAAAVVREIFRRVGAGESCVQVADDLIARDAEPAPRTGWTRAAVYRIVRKRTPVGEWDADKRRGALIRVPAIISEDEWQAAARALLAHKRRGLRRTKHVYLLEALATCAHCGERIAIRSASPARNGRRNPAAYVCRGRKLKDRDDPTRCSAPIVTCADLDGRVWAQLCDEIEQPDLMRALADAGQDQAEDGRNWQTDVDGYRAHLTRLERHEAAVMARFRRGLVSEGALDTELAALARERAMVRDQLATAERGVWAAQSAKARLEAARDVVAQLRAAMPHAGLEDRRALLRELARDGGVSIKNGRARLDLRILRSGKAASRGEGDAAAAIALVDARSYRKRHETISAATLRIRVVA